jgi:hypothetical protein
MIRLLSVKSETTRISGGMDVTQERDFTYITAHFIEQEIAHLARMVRSRHWHYSAAWPVSYWRERIESLRHAPTIAPEQQADLRSLLEELEGIAAKLEPSSSYREMRQAGAQA